MRAATTASRFGSAAVRRFGISVFCLSRFQNTIGVSFKLLLAASTAEVESSAVVTTGERLGRIHRHAADGVDGLDFGGVHCVGLGRRYPCSLRNSHSDCSVGSWATVLEDHRTGDVWRRSWVTIVGGLADDEGEPAVLGVDADDLGGAARECR